MSGRAHLAYRQAGLRPNQYGPILRPFDCAPLDLFSEKKVTFRRKRKEVT